MRYRPPTESERKRYGRLTPTTEALRRDLTIYFEEFSSARLNECDRIVGCDRAYLAAMLSATKRTFSLFAEFLGDKIGEDDIGRALELCSALLINGLVVGGTVGGDLAKSIAKQPHVKGGSLGGVKSGTGRRAKRDNTWVPIALRLALRIVAQNPDMARDDVANEISALWNSTEFDCKGHATLVKFLKEKEQDNELPRRKNARYY